MSETINVGPVHVLTEPGGACVENCPHPVHRPCSTCGGSGKVCRPGWRCGCGRGVSHVANCGRPIPLDPCPDCTAREVSP